ncbi:12908_t:CDS:2, partial [Ambispora gerdemannii]
MDTQTNTNKTLTPEYLEWETKLELPSVLSDKTRSRFYNRYKKKTGLDPWIMSETPESPQIEKTDNYLSQDCVIKISKFPEEKGIIIETVHKRFPFLSYTNSNAWHRDIFKYTNSEAKCPICKKKVIIAKQSLPEIQVSVPNKIQEVEPKKFLSITEAKKK